MFQHSFQGFLISCREEIDQPAFVNSHIAARMVGCLYGAIKVGVTCRASPLMNTS